MQNSHSFKILVLVAIVSGCRTAQTGRPTSNKKQPPEIFQSVVQQSYSPISSDQSLFESRYLKTKEKTPLAPGSKATAEQLYKLIRATRLAGRPSAELNDYAQRLMSLKTEDVHGGWVPLTTLELARDAVAHQKIDLASYYLAKIQADKNPSIQTELSLLQGVIAYLRRDYDLAIKDWNNALKIDANNRAARINLAFLILRTGNAPAVKKLLEPIKDHWLALSGLIVAYRLQNQNKSAEESCHKLQEIRQDYGQGLVNCALLASQNLRNPIDAELLLDRAVANSKRPEISEYAFLLKNELKTTSARIKGKPKNGDEAEDAVQSE